MAGEIASVGPVGGFWSWTAILGKNGQHQRENRLLGKDASPLPYFTIPKWQHNDNCLEPRMPTVVQARCFLSARGQGTRALSRGAAWSACGRRMPSYMTTWLIQPSCGTPQRIAV